MDMKRRKDGFTIVEIAFVTGIIGLLAAMGSYAIMVAVANSRQKTVDIELSMISTATLQLAWDTGRWPNQASLKSPGSTEIWNISPSSAGLTGENSAFSDWKGPYYDGETVDPWGNPYFFDPDYRINGVNHIAVGSFGPNGQGRNVYDDDDIYVLLDD
ncbi:MAG: type II secretion system protein GspG [Pontiella sp.]